MAKRPAVDENDLEELYAEDSPVSKRARTASSDDEAEIVTSLAPQRVSGPSNVRRGNDESDEEVEEKGEEGPNTEDDKFEQEHEEVVRAAIEAKRRVQGGIAEAGIIETIEMHQFMCHQYLTFTFGPQINFIIGHNGSGKSAVLSAITVALGGKAISTGRGNGLKSFIREGQSIAEVTISIKNQGDEAFKPKEYGKSIVITRRFTKDGTSSWKIKSKDDRVISTKKDELSAICDHMNIQVDNPMNVLTQDAARQFLSASHPTDKYKFFLRGTQLSQLSEEYDTCYDNINRTTKVLQQKKEAIPDLKAAFKDASMRFQEASKAREQKKKAEELKKELAWAHVAAKENEMREKIEEAAKLSGRIPKIQEKLDTADAEFKQATEDVARFETEHRALGDIDHLQEKKKSLTEKTRLNKTKIAEFLNEERQMDASLRGANKQIKDLTERIAEESRRMEVDTQAKQEETNRKLEQARAEVRQAESHLEKISEEKQTKMTEMEAVKNKVAEAEKAQSATQTRILQINEIIKKCAEQKKNVWTPYGRDIQRVLDQIAGMRWYGEKPFGPLGRYVKVKDPESWAELLRSQLGHLLTAFTITDSRDRPQLKRLLNQSQNHHMLIIISERDIFDYRAGEPHGNSLTVLRALEISDQFALRILINQAHVEKTFLAKTRAEGEAVLQSVRAGTAWTADWFRVNKFPEGGGSSTRLQNIPRNDPRNLLLTGRDAAGDMQYQQIQLEMTKTEHQTICHQVKHLQQQYHEKGRACNALGNQENEAHNSLRHLKLMYNTLQNEANEELPAGIAGLEAGKADAETEKASIMDQFANVRRLKTVVDDDQKSLLARIDAIKEEIDNFVGSQNAASSKVENAAAARMEAQHSKTHYAKKLAEEQEKFKEAEEIAKVLQDEFSSWTIKAEEYYERVEKPRKVEEVQRNLDCVQTALREREKKHGATVDELTVEVNKAKSLLDAADRDLKTMTSLNNALKASLTVRLARWEEFRRHIALRCKLVFGYHLSNRGYYGKVLFDHSAQTLQLKVQTDDQAGTQGRHKDARSLSGGEKSFSTICLLLSLWEAIGCPIRCLDEFDVFMDAVNRRISMKMMIETATTSDKKQYILITPQDMNNIHIGKNVRVHRMTDPERGQRLLAF